MYSVNLRKVGGSVMLAVPSSILQLLDMAPNSQVSLKVKEGKLIIEPKAKPTYSLEQLLQEQTQTGLDNDAWQDMPAVGHELL